MTEKVNPSPNRPAEAFKTAGAIAYGGSTEGFVVNSNSPTAIAKQDSGIDETALNVFAESHTSTSLDVTIDAGEAFIFGSWVCIDTSTTVSLASSTSNQTVYLGWNKDSTNDVIIGLNQAFTNVSDDTDQRIPLYDFDTDSTGVTNVTDRIQLGKSLDAPGGIDLENSSISNISDITGSTDIAGVDEVDIGSGLKGDGSDNIEVDASTVAGAFLSAGINPYELDVQVTGGLENDGAGSIRVQGDAVAGNGLIEGSNAFTIDINTGGVGAPEIADNSVTNTEMDNTEDYTARTYKGEDGIIHGDTLESGDSLTIQSDEAFVAGESFDINGDATINGDLVVVSNKTSHDELTNVDPTDHLEVVKEVQIKLVSGSTPAFDGTLTNMFGEETTAFDLTLAPTNGLNDTYAFNFDDGKRWQNGSWDVPLTINWDEDPGSDLDLTVRIHRRT